jgi:diphthamide biosynthesis protein 3
MAAQEDDQIAIYDEVEIEDMTFDETTQLYHYPCPCGDRFEIALLDLRDEADIAVCPSCSLMIRVIFEVVSFSFFLFVFFLRVFPSRFLLFFWGGSGVLDRRGKGEGGCYSLGLGWGSRLERCWLFVVATKRCLLREEGLL